jgi:hypothetical protein
MSNKDQQSTTSSPPPQEATPAPVTTAENNNDQSSEQQQTPKAFTRNTKAKQQPQQPQQAQPNAQVNTMQGGEKISNSSGNVAKDNQGNVNVSRGIIGLKSSPSSTTKSYITEGTIADTVNAPSKFRSAEGDVNSLSEQDLQNRISMERSKAGLDKEYQEQLMIKIRTEAQNFSYKPEGKWADAEKYPELQATATESQVQAKEPTVNNEQGEQLLTSDEQIQIINDSNDNIDNH